MRKGKVEIVVVADAVDFRRLAGTEVRSNDSVLEIGCSTGKTTRILAEHCKRVVAVEHSKLFFKKAQDYLAGGEKKEPFSGEEAPSGVEIELLDARDVAAVAKRIPDPDVIFLDIGGTARLDQLASILRQYLKAFSPRLFVVRNEELAELAQLITRTKPLPESRLLRSDPNGPEPGLAPLLALSQSPATGDRRFAARKLRKLNDPLARKRLTEMTQDASPSVRRAAAQDKKNAETLKR